MTLFYRFDSRLSFFVCRALVAVGCLLFVGCRGDAQEKNLADQMPRIPSKTVDEAQQTFKLQHGFALQLVASEPDVVDPIDAAFDEQGRMYVVEMNDYPFLPEQRVQKYKDQRAETWGRIRLLTDTDVDGRMDHSIVFADMLRWPQSVCCSRGGVYVLSTPNLYYMKDTNGDGVADVKEVICTGFASSNVQGLSNGLEWGRDNAIYFSSGMSGGELTVPARNGRPKFSFTPGRRDLRLDPETHELTMVAGGLQFGHTIDDWGNRFVCSNSSHIVHVTWPLKYLERNPLQVIPDMTRAIAKEGAAAVVFRTSPAEPWRLVRTARRAADPEMRKRLPPTELVPIGFFTSATGITVYRGDAYPEQFQGNVFIGDCGGNLFHRKTLTPDGISFVAERADQNVEFMTSTDNWFRPVNFVNAPDGTLYVMDMYRETIEHPISIPDDIKALVDLESGHDKGRIWRLVPPNYRRAAPANLAKASTSVLVTNLRSTRAWVRDTAQRLLVERQDKSAVEWLRELVRGERPKGFPIAPPQSRIHALWTLHGLKQLRADDVQSALVDADEHVREEALRMAPELIPLAPELATAVISLANDPSQRVRWQLALTVGDLPPHAVVAGLKQLAPSAANDAEIRVAWLSSCYSQMSELAAELLKGDTAPVRTLLADVARLIGSSKVTTDSIRLLDSVLSQSIPDATRVPVLLALGEGLRRRGTAIDQLLTDSKANSASRQSLMELFQRAGVTAQDSNATEPDRLLAIRLLALSNTDASDDALAGLFVPQAPPELQRAAVKSIAMHGTGAAYQRLIESWRGFAPATRLEVVDNLVQSADGAIGLINAVEQKSIQPGDIDRDKRQLLLTHPQARIREAAKKQLAEPPSNRKDVIAKYQSVLNLTGDPVKGRLIFNKTCSQCHRLGTAGHLVGPDFASVQNKSPEDLLIAILDPNREALPNFRTYTVVTKQGTILAGIIAAETAASLTLKRAEAKEDVVLRDTVDEMVSNGVSLMPEGLEKDIDPQQLADIIALIKAGP